MASANLRYHALRSRLRPQLLAFAQGALPPAELADLLVRELYRALAHLTAVAVYQADDSQLTTLAAHGPIEHPVIALGQGIPGAALAAGDVVFVPDRSRDDRVLATTQPFAAELAVALHGPGQPLVVAVLAAEPRALGYGDRDLFAWLAQAARQL